MEARAQQRAERRKEIEELKRKKDEEKLVRFVQTLSGGAVVHGSDVLKYKKRITLMNNFQAEMKAAEERRQREEEEEKRKAAEKRREEKRQEREVCIPYFMDRETERHESEYYNEQPSPETRISLIKQRHFLQREEEKQMQLKRQQELLKLARQHYYRTLLLRRGLAPWKRFIQLRKASMEVNHLPRHFVLTATQKRVSLASRRWL